MSIHLNQAQAKPNELTWLSVEPLAIDVVSCVFQARFILAWWTYWDMTPKQLEQINGIADAQFIAMRETFLDEDIDDHPIIKAGFRADPLMQLNTPGRLLDDDPIAATVGYRWSITGPWTSLQRRILEFSEEYLDVPLDLEPVFEYDNMYFKDKRMDKLINKVKADVNKNDKPKAKKDIRTLLKADKKQDVKVERCDKIKKRK